MAQCNFRSNLRYSGEFTRTLRRSVKFHGLQEIVGHTKHCELHTVKELLSLTLHSKLSETHMMTNIM